MRSSRDSTGTLTTLGFSVLLVVIWAVAVSVGASIAHSAERSPDYKAGVCDGLRRTKNLDPSQPIAVVLPNGTNHRCQPIAHPRGLPPTKVELRDCVRFNCDPNAPYAIPRARRVVPE